jgi:hypothetical protein
MGECAAEQHCEPSTVGKFHYAGNRYSANDDNIKALDFGAHPSGSWARAVLLSDQAIWATIAGVVRQSGA